MMKGFLRRGLLVTLYLICVAALAAGVWRYATLQGLAQLSSRAGADLALASDRLTGQLQRYRDLAVNLADHPQVTRMLAGAIQPEDTALLRAIADRSAASDVIVVDRMGRVMGAAEDGAGAVDAQRYIARARNGALGRGYGPSSGRTPRSFFFAAPVFGPQGQALGAVVVSTDLSSVEYAWRGDTPPVFFTDGVGRVQVSNRSELINWVRADDAPGLRPPDGGEPDFSVTYSGPHEIWRLGWGRYLPQEALHLSRDLPVIGMTGEVLVDVAPVRKLAFSQAAAVAALCLLLGALLFLATERRLTLARLNAQLEARVTARTQALRAINTELRREVAERREAETALEQAQDELVRASKLSALGQLSAGISHELNQPLMAVQTFAENGIAFLERGKPERAAENLGRISEMTRRMGRIIGNLRAFSRQESVEVVAVELGQILASAIELARLRSDDLGVRIDYAPPLVPVWVRGGEVRLGQVFMNLIANALDAMADTDRRVLGIEIELGARVVVTISDTGGGITEPDKVFDPFYTTKEVGAAKGMGLGLSISYAIVRSIGGEIRAQNAERGASFSVALLPAAQEQVA
ncbi:ATP-binding protein [Sulfitobacter sp. HNIBRBA3233]|uniref:sensor histidine kinase n=1 Tax=Sulfitobacter marinivivus TaxID=3158558 RepID=UPI0032DEB0D3